MKRLIQGIFFVCVGLSLFGQEKDVFRKSYELSLAAKDYYEGYALVSGSSDFSYASFREDISESMLTRCTDGEMTIQWKTESSSDSIADGAGFLWIVAINLKAERHRFDVCINGVKRFEIYSGPESEWSISNEDGGELHFHLIKKDHHGDAHGYMSMWAPNSWFTAGESLEISITGSAENSNTWIIVYKASDALSFLHSSVEYSYWFDMELSRKGKKYNALIKSPSYFAGKELKINSPKGELKTILKKDGLNSIAEFTLPSNILGSKLVISDEQGEVVNLTSFGEETEEMKLSYQTVIINKVINKDNEHIFLSAQRLYRPKTGSSLLKLSETILNDGQIFLMNSSHQDIAWMDSPEKCVIERDTMLLLPLFDKASSDPAYRFDIEDALMLKEFIQRHPDRKDEVAELLSSGILSCGSTYIQPYEEMYSGESLARQFYFGARWLKKEFGYTADTYWNVDVPGRTLQMPQIMKKAGTKYLMHSRFERGLNKWYSPDGSFITAFSPGHYGDAFIPLQRNFFEAARFLADNFLLWEDYYTESSIPAIPLLSDWDMSPANDYSEIINNWAMVSEIQDENGDYKKVTLPKFRVATAPEFFRSVEKEAPRLKEIRGERPAVWLYIHGPSHYQALKASREADICLTQAEKFNSALSASRASFLHYPQDDLNRAWEAKIFPDHGWGGKNGDITDALFKEKYEFALSESKRMMADALMQISSDVQYNEESGFPLIVFNSLSWERDDIARIKINFPRGEARSVILHNSEGKEIPVQLSEIERYSDSSLKKAMLVFAASNIPSVGYSTYYYNYSDVYQQMYKPQIDANKLSNEFYELELSSRGITKLIDKQSGKDIIDAGDFAGAEVFTMSSIGYGAGEFSDIQKVDMKDYDYTGSGNDDTNWDLYETGSVFTKYRIRQKIKHATVLREITVYHQKKKIDIDISLLNWEGVLYREFRLAFPVNMNDAKVSYQVPYGVVTVGEDEIDGPAGERYESECSDIHPRGIENWIGVNNKEFGLVMSSCVAVVDYEDHAEKRFENTVLQPVLLASRKSCHGLGNEYLQTGDHKFHFSISTHNPGWENAYKFGIGSNEKLQLIAPQKKYSDASLPGTLSFVSVDKENIIISAIKKSEDDNTLIIRAYEVEGKDTDMTISLFRQIDSVYSANLIEYPSEKLDNSKYSFKAAIGHHSIETYIIKLK